MKKQLKRRIATLFTLLLISATVLANPSDNQPVESFFDSQHKIYVVFAVVAIIFIVIVFFLLHLERKISKMEKRFGSDKN